MTPVPFPCLAFVQRAEALGDPAWATRPTRRELVFPLGEPPSNDDRKWRFTQEDLAGVLVDSRSWNEPKPVYWAHGKDQVKGGKAAGWIDHLELDADGLYAWIRYTDEALAEIRGGAWGFRSPGFDAIEDKDGAVRPRRLFELSLVNEPAIGAMPAITAARTDPGPIPATPSPAEASQRKETRMEKLRALLGLADGASEDDFCTAVAALKEATAPPPAPDPEVHAAAAARAVDEVVARRLTEELAKRDHAAAVEAAVEAAVRTGKVTQAQRGGALAFAKADLPAFEAFAAAAPVVVPLSAVIAGAQVVPGIDTATQNYADRVRAERNAALAAAQQ